MNKTLVLLGLLLTALSASAVEITGQPMGVHESAEPYYYVPQYLPYYPTAATIWARVIEVPCEKAADGKVTCEGYNWTPNMGRAEYLFIMPKIKQPTTVTNTIINNTVIKEVPVKKGKE